ncbi:MAG: hypothetical protein GQ571_13745 [Desulfobacterales bacterium]|jgi:hypothetical protein|nr:hypothetical protein [Desulfobacterales bacterium]
MIIFFSNFGKCQQGGTVERAMLWFKCAAVHDPVRPVLKKPAVIGWEAKQRQVDLVLERSFQGEELLRRMKDWFTADVYQVINTIHQHAKLKVVDGYDLVVETASPSELETLSRKLKEEFGQEVWVEPIPKTLLT